MTVSESISFRDTWRVTVAGGSAARGQLELHRRGALINAGQWHDAELHHLAGRVRICEGKIHIRHPPAERLVRPGISAE
jgi:hypothetical protein